MVFHNSGLISAVIASTICISPIPYFLGILLHEKRLQHTHSSNSASQSDSVQCICLPADHSTFTSGTNPNQMHSIIQLFLLLPILILTTTTTTTTNATVDSDTNDVIIRKPTSSYCAPPPYPPTSPCDTVPEMNRTNFKLATTFLDDTHKHAWYLPKGGKWSERNSKEIHEKVGNTGNGDDRIDNPDHYPCDGCLCAHFLDRFSENSECDRILRRSWATTNDACISVSLSSHLMSHLSLRLPVSPLPLVHSTVTLMRLSRHRIKRSPSSHPHLSQNGFSACTPRS